MSESRKGRARSARAYCSRAEVLLEEMPAGVLALDRRWRVAYANRVAEKLARQPRSCLLGRRLFDVFPEAAGSEFERQYRRVFEEGAVVEFEAYYQPYDMWVQVRASPIDEGLVANLVDVTERRRAEQSLAEQRAEARAREAAEGKRLVAAREELLAVVSHDLRNPLTTILGGMDLLAAAGTLPPRERTIVARVRRAAYRMRRLIGDLLDFSRIEQGALKVVRGPTRLESVVEEAADAAKPRISQRQQRLALDVSPRLPVVEADRERLLQVLGNLLDNAIKHTPEGGLIELSAAPNGRGGVRVAVTDSGPGLDERAQGRLFEPFWQAEPGHEGAGLGLFIARAIVEAHDGRIWVENPPGRGSRFVFILPPPSETTSAKR